MGFQLKSAKCKRWLYATALACKKSRMFQNVQIKKIIGCVQLNFHVCIFTKLPKWKTQNPDDFNPHYYCICYCYCNWKSRGDAAIYPAQNGLKLIVEEYPCFLTFPADFYIRRDVVRFSNPGGASSNVVGIICPLWME